MAVRYSPERQAELESAWKDIKEYLVSEFRLVALARDAQKRDCVYPVCPGEDGRRYYLDMTAGVPVISERQVSGGRISGPVAVVYDEGEFGNGQLDGLYSPFPRVEEGRRLFVLDNLVKGWDGIKSGLSAQMDGIRRRCFPLDRLESLLVMDLVAEDRSLDRATFYAATSYLDDRQLFESRERIRRSYLGGLPEGRGDREEMAAIADRSLERTFSIWNRLGGRLDWRLWSLGDLKGSASLDDVIKTADFALKDPGYAAFRGKELKAWVRNRCSDYGLDYSKVPERLKPRQRSAAVRDQVKI